MINDSNKAIKNIGHEATTNKQLLMPEKLKQSLLLTCSKAMEKTGNNDKTINQMPARKSKAKSQLKLLYQAKFLVYKSNKNAMNNIGHEGTNE